MPGSFRGLVGASPDHPEGYDFPTLPDLLAPGMHLVFVGINPSLYAVRVGHYFARPTNRFWPAFSASVLSVQVREELGVERLGAEMDRELPRYGIGFTDVVKIPSNTAAQIPPGAYREWTPRLVARLERMSPRLACFHGVTGYRPFLRYGLGIERKDVSLGAQPEVLGRTNLYVVPNPSPANAHFTMAEQTEWYDRVAEYLTG